MYGLCNGHVNVKVKISDGNENMANNIKYQIIYYISLLGLLKTNFLIFSYIYLSSLLKVRP